MNTTKDVFVEPAPTFSLAGLQKVLRRHWGAAGSRPDAVVTCRLISESISSSRARSSSRSLLDTPAMRA